MSDNKYTAQLLKKAFNSMLLIRKFEEKAAQLYTMKMIAGFCHLYIGQEAIATALKMASSQDDSFITGYRCHGFMLAAGTDPNIVMAELCGKRTGCSMGYGGSMHMFDPQNNFYGGHGVVGAQIPIGTGIAFAEKYRQTKNICITVLGDGAANQGQFYESCNIAKLWDLPVLYVIENNMYALGTSLERSTKAIKLYKRGLGLEIDGQQVNGMNFFEMYDAAQNAINYVREKQTPFILEAITYRYKGHSMSDPAHYRTKEEVEKFKDRDSISLVKNYMKENGMITNEEISVIEAAVKSAVQAAVEYSKMSKDPEISDLECNVIL